MQMTQIERMTPMKEIEIYVDLGASALSASYFVVIGVQPLMGSASQN